MDLLRQYKTEASELFDRTHREFIKEHKSDIVLLFAQRHAAFYIPLAELTPTLEAALRKFGWDVLVRYAEDKRALVQPPLFDDSHTPATA